MTKTITDMKQKQAEALRLIKEQGLRVLVCCGTGCISSGAESVYQKFKELGVNVLPLSTYDKMTVMGFVSRVFLLLFLIFIQLM